MRLPLFIYKYARYEYWPWLLFYIPVLPYWLYLALKNRSLAYFSAANPGIELGGFYGESKSEILKSIDKHYLPAAIEVDGLPFDSIIHLLGEQHIGYPVIAKPDVGERGNDVAKIHNEPELAAYHARAKSKYIIQEFVDYDIELGVLYSRLPDSKKGQVSSVTLKEFLSVTGDGKSTIKQLMQKSVRARFQIRRLEKEMGSRIHNIPGHHEKLLLEPIGNHCRGTRFIDNNFLINERLNEVFDAISLPIAGFYYGRFDLKVRSIEDLYQGTNIRILELNGASSEPGHIYDIKNTLFSAYRDLMHHWKRLAEVSQGNVQKGHKPVPFLSIVKSYFKFVVFKNNNKERTL
jgi:hypothetical protein